MTHQRPPTPLYQILIGALIFVSCERAPDKDFLGSAVIESGTWTIASVVQGPLLAVYVEEGMRVKAGELLALVDTLPLQYQREEIAAGIGEIEATLAAKKAEIEAISVDVNGLEREFSRIDALAAKGAAPTQQRDNLSTQLQSAKAKLDAARSALKPLSEKEKSLRVRRSMIDYQVDHSSITSPVNGVVFTRFRNTGEVVGPGSPIVEVGVLDTVTADFFVPQPMLASLVYGQKVRIRLDWDSAGTLTGRYFPATITWIGDEAEFSPKNIQTRPGRNELVFRIRCTAANPSGNLKRGLPVEIWR